MYSLTTATRKIAQLTKRIRAVTGGTSASKTISILLYLIAKCQSDESPTLTSIVSESMPHLKRGAIRDFLNIMKEHNYYDDERWNKTESTYTFETGSKIEFFSADQPGKVRWPRRHRLFVNEGNNVDYESFDQLLIRTEEFAFIDWNPVCEFYMYTDFIGKRDDVEFITLTYKDNEALSESIVKEIESHMDNKRWWTVYWEGKLGEVEGKIYKDWQIIDSVPHEARLERYWLDFGYTNDPTAIVAIYTYNGGYILDEIAFQKWLSNKQIADILKSYPTSLIIADSAEPKSIDEIKTYWLTIIGAEKWPDSIKNGIQLVQAQKISVTKGSINIIKEYRNYMWSTDRDGKILNVPESWFDHSMDAIRYWFSNLLKTSSTSFDVKSFIKNELHSRNNIYNDIGM